MSSEKYSEICMRLYRGFDADLLALHETGIPVNTLAGILIDAYAEGRYIRVIPETCKPYNPSLRTDSILHLQVRIRTEAGRQLVSSVRYGYRNQFSKTIVRNALAAIPFTGFFKDGAMAGTEQDRLRSLSGDGIIVLPPGLTQKQYTELLQGTPGVDIPPSESRERGETDPVPRKSRSREPQSGDVTRAVSAGSGEGQKTQIGAMRPLRRGASGKKPAGESPGDMKKKEDASALPPESIEAGKRAVPDRAQPEAKVTAAAAESAPVSKGPASDEPAVAEQVSGRPASVVAAPVEQVSGGPASAEPEAAARTDRFKEPAAPAEGGKGVNEEDLFNTAFDELVKSKL